MTKSWAMAIAVALCSCGQAQPDPALAESARAALTAAVDALAAPDIAHGVVNIDNMVAASPSREVERPQVYARIFAAAWRATGEQRFLDYFRAVADLVVAMRQPSGGYAHTAYVKEVGAQETHEAYVTFRDGHDLSALTAILQAYDLTRDERYLQAATETADLLIQAQHECGAWPSNFPVPTHGWLRLPMLNDSVTITQTRSLMRVYEETGDPAYLAAIERAGPWFIDWQLPEPTPGWAQEYTFDRTPAWGRRFEPAAACSAPSMHAIGLLTDIHLLTGDDKYLAPIPAAVAWLERSRLPDGRWARFYETKTNRPLYFTSDDRTTYRLTYDDSDAPDHYTFKGAWGLEAHKARWERLQQIGREAFITEQAAGDSLADLREKVPAMEQSVREYIAPDGRVGRYVTEGGSVTRLASDLGWVALYLTRCEDLQRRAATGH